VAPVRVGWMNLNFSILKSDINNMVNKSLPMFQRNLLPFILQMEGACSSEMSVLRYQTAVCYIPEDYSVNILEI